MPAPHSIAFASLSAFFIFAFFLTLRIHPTTPAEDRAVRIGDIYGHLNPGKATPNQPAQPFVQIYRVVEIRAGQAKCLIRACSFSGNDCGSEFSDWYRLDLFQYDHRLIRGPASE